MMITCKECGKEISDTAKTCPHCGHANMQIPQKKNTGCLKFFLIGSALIFLLYLLGFLGSGSSTETSQSLLDSTAVTSERVVKDPVQPVVDSARLRELRKLFTEKKDDFENITWVKPKSKPQYINQNGAYLYFSTTDGRAHNLRFVIQYAAEDWLFVNTVKFIVDGKNYDYYSGDWKTDHDSGIWEWSDEAASENAVLIEAIANAKTVKYRLDGTTYYKDKTLSTAYIKSIRNTLEYYKLLGGKL